jgi:hypothetical protein
MVSAVTSLPAVYYFRISKKTKKSDRLFYADFGIRQVVVYETSETKVFGFLSLELKSLTVFLWMFRCFPDKIMSKVRERK